MIFGFIPTEGGHFYKQSLLQVEWAEKLGFDSVWIEEHHGVKNHYWPSPLTVLAGYATRTTRLILGTNIAVLPFYNPVRIAEKAVLLDLMSEGRFILGIAIGYRPDEFVMLSTPMEKRGARFAEAVKLIRRLWMEDEVTFKGEFYHFENITLEPKPLTKPHPPIWIGGWGPLSLKRAAELGDAWIPGPTADLDKLMTCQTTYHQHLMAIGKDPSQIETPLTRDTVIAETDEEAWQVAEEHLLAVYQNEYANKWKHPLINKRSTPQIKRLKDFAQNRFIIGCPKSCVEQIDRYRESFGVDHLIFRLYAPGISHAFIMKELELISQEIMPAFAS